MSLDQLDKCFRVAVLVHEHANGAPISIIIVRDFVRDVFNVSSSNAIKNNIDFMFARKFLTSNVGMVSTQKDITDIYAKFRKRYF